MLAGAWFDKFDLIRIFLFSAHHFIECFFLLIQTAPETFAFEEMVVNENKIVSDVHLQGAAFVVVSCKTLSPASKKE